MSILVLLPLYTFHISIQTIAMSDFGDTLITYDFDTNIILLKIWLILIILSTTLELSKMAVFS